MMDKDRTVELGESSTSLEAVEVSQTRGPEQRRRQPRRRRRFLIVCALLGFLVSVVLSLFLGWLFRKSEDEDDEDSSIALSSATNRNVEGFYGGVSHMTEDNASNATEDTVPLQNVTKWLNATVTIQDGARFEIVGDPLVHDPNAFS